MKNPESMTALTVRLYSEEERQAVKIAMKETGCRQASRALIKMCLAFSRLAGLVKSQSAELKRLQAENVRLRKCMAVIRQAQTEADRVMQEHEPDNINRLV